MRRAAMRQGRMLALVAVVAALLGLVRGDPARIGASDGSNLDLYAAATRVHSPLIVTGVNVTAVIAELTTYAPA